MRVVKHSMSFVNTATTYTQTSTGYIDGLIYAIQYKPSTGTVISDTADLTITTEDSSQILLDSLSVSTGFLKAPRLPIVNTTNGAIANSGGLIAVADERFKVKASKTTSTGQSGTFYIWSL